MVLPQYAPEPSLRSFSGRGPESPGSSFGIGASMTVSGSNVLGLTGTLLITDKITPKNAQKGSEEPLILSSGENAINVFLLLFTR